MSLALLTLLNMHAANEIAGAAEQLAWIERLGHVIVSTGFQSEYAIDLLVFAGNQDDADVRVCTHFAGQRQSVLAWQLDIQKHEDDIRIADETVHFITAASGRNAKSFFLEIGDELLASAEVGKGISQSRSARVRFPGTD